MVNSLNDGLSKPDQLADDAVVSDEMAYGQLALGSPSAIGNISQGGSITTNAGSLANVVYGTAFKAVPRLIVSAQDGTGVLLTAGSLATTGFTAHSTGGSKILEYIAIGSGTI